MTNDGAGVPAAPATGNGRKGLFTGIGVVVVAGIAAAAYFLFFAGSAGAATPAAAVRQLLDAAKAHDVGKAKAALCAADRALGDAVLSSAATSELTAYTVGATTSTNSTHAKVHVTITTKGTGTEAVDLPTVKESDAWKVCLTDLLRELPTSAPSTAAASDTPTGTTPTDTAPAGTSTAPSSGSTFGTDGPASNGSYCPSSDSSRTPADVYIGALAIDSPDDAQGCVYQSSVPASLTKSLAGKAFSRQGDDHSGGNEHGDTGTYVYANVDGSNTLTITTTKEADGRYWITDVKVS